MNEKLVGSGALEENVLKTKEYIADSLPQKDSLPTATQDLVNVIYQYTGTTTQDYVNGFFYQCQLVNGVYKWVYKPVQEGSESIQVDTLPNASATYADVILEYVGATNNFYTNGYFYKCVENNSVYSWVNIPVQDSEDIQLTSLPTASADYFGDVVQYVGATGNGLVHNYFYECVSDGAVNPTFSWQVTKVQEGDAIQVTTLPTASASNLGEIYQYVGTTTQNYINGYFYQSVSDGQPTPTYSWEAKKVQKGGGHTIQNASGTDLTERDTMQFKKGFSATDDSTNQKTVVNADTLQEGDMDDIVTPLPSGGGSGGGHTIEDSTGTALTQRDVMQFSDSFAPTDDSTDEVTKIALNKLTSGEMDDIVTPLPSVQPKWKKYSTDEQLIGEWIDGSYIYEKTIDCGTLVNGAGWQNVPHNISNIGSTYSISAVCVNTSDTRKSIQVYSAPTGFGYSVYVEVDSTNISINSGSDRGSEWHMYVTIRYTKSSS